VRVFGLGSELRVARAWGFFGAARMGVVGRAMGRGVLVVDVVVYFVAVSMCVFDFTGYEQCG